VEKLWIVWISRMLSATRRLCNYWHLYV